MKSALLRIGSMRPIFGFCGISVIYLSHLGIDTSEPNFNVPTIRSRACGAPISGG